VPANFESIKGLAMSFVRSYFYTTSALLTVCAFAVVTMTAVPAIAAESAPNQSLEDVLGIPPPASDAEPVTPIPPVDEPATQDEEVGDLLKKIESDEATKQQPPVSPAPTMAETEPGYAGAGAVPETVPVAADDSTAPSAEGLATPDVDVNVEASTTVSEVPALPAGEVAEDKLFFDSESLVPTGEMRTSAPRKVNPQLEPASKLIVVKKNAGAGTPQAQLVSANRAIQLGRYDSALRIYNEMYKKNSRDPNVLFGRAVALQKLGQTDEAIHAYEQALDASPENPEAQINMLGLIAERYPAVALQRLNAMTEDYPDDVRLLAQIAIVQARLGHYSEALSSLGVAASLDQNNASHVFNMGVIADRAGNKKDAIAYYEKALEVDAVYGGSRTVPRDSIYERLAQLR
jgi:Flp pilus assembly protein TadD